MGITWTDAKLERLRALAAMKLSSSEVAKSLTAEFGVPITRNMVIGKCQRKGIDLNHAGRQPKRKIRDLLAEERPPKPEPPPSVPEFEATEFHNAGPNQCRYIAGRPSFRAIICGNETVTGSAYCAKHRAMLYVPVRKKEEDYKMKKSLFAYTSFV